MTNNLEGQISALRQALARAEAEHSRDLAELENALVAAIGRIEALEAHTKNN